MAQYHQRPDEVPSRGRTLSPEGGFNTTIVLLERLLRPGEVLLGWYDAGGRQLAPHLETQEDVTHFYQQYRAGGFLRMDYYAFPEARFDAE